MQKKVSTTKLAMTKLLSGHAAAKWLPQDFSPVELEFLFSDIVFLEHLCLYFVKIWNRYYEDIPYCVEIQIGPGNTNLKYYILWLIYDYWIVSLCFWNFCKQISYIFSQLNIIFFSPKFAYQIACKDVIKLTLNSGLNIQIRPRQGLGTNVSYERIWVILKIFHQG